MHARTPPLPLVLSVGLQRLFLLVLAFAFALAMGALAVQGAGPRTVQFSFPDAAKMQTAPTSPVVPAPR